MAVHTNAWISGRVYTRKEKTGYSFSCKKPRQPPRVIGNWTRDAYGSRMERHVEFKISPYMRVFEGWEIIKIWRKPGNLESMKYENVCLPGRRLWRKAGSREVPPILEDFDPCRSSKCARFYTKSARLRYRLRSRSSSRSNQTETRFIPHDRNLVRQIYKRIHTHTHIYMYIYIFANLYSNVVPVKLNLPPETPGVKPGNAFDPRLQPLPRLGRDPEPLIDVHIGIQWQSASMEVESVQDLVADHRTEGRVRRVRGSAVPGPRPGCHHSQWDAWNRRSIFFHRSSNKIWNNDSRVFRFFFTNRVRRRFVVGVHAVRMTTPAKVKKKFLWLGAFYIRFYSRISSFERNVRDEGEVSYFSVTFLLKTLSSTVRICWNRLNTVWKKSSGSISTCRKRREEQRRNFNSINVSIYRVWNVRKEALTHLGHFSGQ